jgi:predicted transcriptional regulator
VYVTAKSPAGGPAAAPVRVLAAVPVDSYDAAGGALSGSSTGSLVLAVPSASVASTVRAVESGSIDIVRVPDAVAAGSRP